ncbi:hypothetical protein PM082_019640 [Marasmius tenuissimus]|nr:hypothetical protein PM082_019640 [Marasmius tenuissimus]
MTDTICSIPSNPDIAGIGVRASVYAQACLALFISILTEYKFFRSLGPFKKAEKPPPRSGPIKSSYIRIIQNLEQSIFMVGLATIISAIIESVTSDGLTPYHSLIVLNMSFINTEVGWLLVWWRFYIIEDKFLSYKKWFWPLLHSALFGAFGIYFWARQSASVDNDMDPNTGDRCQPLTLFWVFRPVSTTNFTLKIISLIFYALTTIPVVGIAFHSLITSIAALATCLVLFCVFEIWIVVSVVVMVVAMVAAVVITMIIAGVIGFFYRIIFIPARYIMLCVVDRIPWLRESLDYISTSFSGVHQPLSIRWPHWAASASCAQVGCEQVLVVFLSFFISIFLATPIVYTIMSTEYIVRSNSPNVTERENDWTYGQTLALLMALMAIFQNLQEWWHVLKEERKIQKLGDAEAGTERSEELVPQGRQLQRRRTY